MVLDLVPTSGVRGGGGPPDALDRFVAASRRTGVLAAALTIAVQLVAPGLLADHAVAVVLAGVLLGIPHGAVDHLVPFWSRARGVTGPALLAGLTSYVVTAAAAGAAFVLAPTPTVWTFLVVSAVHFGRGEVVVAAQASDRRPPAAWQDLAPMLAHGLAVVALPVVLWPQVSLPVLGRLAAPLATVPTRALEVGLTVTAVALVVAAGSLLHAGRHAELAELALVTTLFVLVPPLPAFGVYFGLWHALRHSARLVALPGPDGVRLSVRHGVLRYLVHSSVPTALAGALLVVLWHATTTTALGAALATLLALTFPHVRVVARMDRP